MSRVSAALAEELLALVTTRERAASVAGDLAEESGRRGPFWFGVALARVAAALFSSAFAACRVRLLWLLASGFVCWFAVYAAVRSAGAVAGFQPIVLPLTDCVERPWPVQVYLGAALVLSGLLAGAALGTRAPAQGVNGATPLAAGWACLAVVAPLAELAAGTATWHCTLLYLLGLPFLYMLPLLAGGALGARAVRG